MRSSTIIATSLSVLLLPISAAVQIPARFEPFFPSHLDDVLISNDTLIPGEEHELLKRANNCPSNYNSCSTFSAAASGACCTKNSICTTDGNRNIACCPTGATCTGTIASRTAVATTSATVTATYVSNIYFPFPSIPTSYDNSAACTSAYSACQSNYALCTQDLSGNGFGVTVSAIGGGITIAPSGTNVGYSSATSICSSLSSEACQGLETSMCAQYGTASTTTSGVTTTSGNTVFIVGATSNAAPRPTMGCMAAAGVMAGFGLGMAGRIV